MYHFISNVMISLVELEADTLSEVILLVLSLSLFFFTGWQLLCGGNVSYHSTHKEQTVLKAFNFVSLAFIWWYREAWIRNLFPGLGNPL